MRDALNAERRRLPMVRVEEDYRFQTASGEKRLIDLFEGRPQLVVHHFMWIDARGRGMPRMLDAGGHRRQPGPPQRGEHDARLRVARADREAGGVPRAHGVDDPDRVVGGDATSTTTSTSTIDPSRGATTYNFRDLREMGGMMASYAGDLPGVSVFLRDGDDVYHTYSAYARGTEHESNVFGYLDFTPLGRQDGRDVQPWARLHDRYDA